MSDQTLSPQAIAKAADILRPSQRLVISTGAGVSKESGIPTFRDALEGLWAQYDPQELATPFAFQRNPKFVWDWYQYRRTLLAGARPNPGHEAIVALETMLPQVAVVTQNTDGLHQIAGSRDVIELHGSLRRNKCFAHCQGEPTVVDITTLEWDSNAGPPQCPHCGAWVRPDVVWFHETLPPHAIERAHTLTLKADVMLVVGTSGTVQPAASLPHLAKRNGAQVIEVNPQVSGITRSADVFLAGPSGEVLPQVVALLKAEGTPDE